MPFINLKKVWKYYKKVTKKLNKDEIKHLITLLDLPTNEKEA